MTLMGPHDYKSTFAHAVVVTANMDFEAAAGAVQVHLMVGRDETQSDKMSHIDLQDDHIDTVISHINRPYPISISSMTMSIR